MKRYYYRGRPIESFNKDELQKAVIDLGTALEQSYKDNGWKLFNLQDLKHQSK